MALQVPLEIHGSRYFAVQLKGKAAPVHDKNAYGGVEIQLHPFLISALGGCECSARSGRSNPGTHYVTRQVGDRPGLAPTTRQYACYVTISCVRVTTVAVEKP